MKFDGVNHSDSTLLDEGRRPLAGGIYKGEKKSRFKNRGRLEIVSNLLNRGKNGALKTHLMYGANLSFPLVEEYLDILLKSGLISKELEVGGPAIKYRTSEKGLEFLEHYDMIISLLGDQRFLLCGGFPLIDELGKSTFVRDPMEDSMRISLRKNSDSNLYSR